MKGRLSVGIIFLVSLLLMVPFAFAKEVADDSTGRPNSGAVPSQETITFEVVSDVDLSKFVSPSPRPADFRVLKITRSHGNFQISASSGTSEKKEAKTIYLEYVPPNAQQGERFSSTFVYYQESNGEIKFAKQVSNSIAVLPDRKFSEILWGTNALQVVVKEKDGSDVYLVIPMNVENNALTGLGFRAEAPGMYYAPKANRRELGVDGTMSTQAGVTTWTYPNGVGMTRSEKGVYTVNFASRPANTKPASGPVSATLSFEPEKPAAATKVRLKVDIQGYPGKKYVQIHFGSLDLTAKTFACTRTCEQTIDFSKDTRIYEETTIDVAVDVLDSKRNSLKDANGNNLVVHKQLTVGPASPVTIDISGPSSVPWKRLFSVSAQASRTVPQIVVGYTEYDAEGNILGTGTLKSCRETQTCAAAFDSAYWNKRPEYGLIAEYNNQVNFLTENGKKLRVTNVDARRKLITIDVDGQTAEKRIVAGSRSTIDSDQIGTTGVYVRPMEIKPSGYTTAYFDVGIRGSVNVSGNQTNYTITVNSIGQNSISVTLKDVSGRTPDVTQVVGDMASRKYAYTRLGKTDVRMLVRSIMYADDPNGRKTSFDVETDRMDGHRVILLIGAPGTHRLQRIDYSASVSNDPYYYGHSSIAAYSSIKSTTITAQTSSASGARRRGEQP